MKLNDVETMRSLASRAARVFDPLGFVQPVLIQAKRLMQACWRAKLSWNDPLPPEILEPWSLWASKIYFLHYLDFPRLLMIRDAVSIQLHGFSDASSHACAAVVYCRSINASGKVHVAFVASKTKLAPLLTVSIPRLELQAALLLAQLMKKVTDCLNERDVVLWTDSSCVLSWLQKPPYAWKTFVANRVCQLLELFPVDTWRHVNTYENIADVPSRGMSAPALVKCKEWIEGPTFLWEPEEIWPKSPFPPPSPAIDLEVKEPEPLCLLANKDNTSELFELIFRNVRPFYRNLRLLAYIIRFTRNAKLQLAHLRVTHRYPSTHELKNALHVWARYVQGLHFSEEIWLLQRKKPVANSSLRQLQAFYDDTTGLMSVGGRLALATYLEEEAKHPIILPKHDELVESYVLQLHLAMNHVGPETLLAHIRTRFWLLHGRRECKRILHRCIRCWRLRAKPFVQSMAPLPTGRINPSHAWLRVGIDYCGPFHVLKEKIFPGDIDVFGKVWVLLATDLASRGVHLEMMYSMDTEHLINALQRMIARRGHPEVIYSDNAKSFHKASRQMQKLYRQLDWDKVERFCLKLPAQIQFRFSAPLAPHTGGVWERLVRSTKAALKSTFGKERATLEHFRTVLVNAESCINSRPLTSVSDDSSDPLPITPAHLSIGRAIMQIPDFLSRDDYAGYVSNSVQWKGRSRLHAHYWGRFRKEYLAGLQSMQKWTQPGYEPRLNEVVLLADPPRGRQDWPLARIIELFPGRDGKTRSVLLFQNAQTEPIRRDIRYIMRLEDSCIELDIANAPVTDDVDVGAGGSDHPLVALFFPYRPIKSTTGTD